MNNSRFWLYRNHYQQLLAWGTATQASFYLWILDQSERGWTVSIPSQGICGGLRPEDAFDLTKAIHFTYPTHQPGDCYVQPTQRCLSNHSR